MTVQSIPVYRAGDLVLAIELDVAGPDADGEAWLTPRQVAQLEAARRFASAWIESGERAAECDGPHHLAGLVTISFPPGLDDDARPGARVREASTPG